jgi:hypothetical protein
MNVRQNAQVIVNAERYYRAMTTGPTSWNIHRHMVHTLENLMEFHGAVLKELSGNTILIGDARATDMCDDGTVKCKSLTKSTNRRRCFQALVPTRGRLLLDEWGCYAGYAGS